LLLLTEPNDNRHVEPRNVPGTGAVVDFVTVSDRHEHVTSPRLASPTAALVVGAVVLVLLAAFPPILSLAHELSLGSYGAPYAIFIPCAAVGFLVARRRPANPIGWLLLLGIGAGVLGTDAGYYAWAAYGVRHHGLPLDWLALFVGECWSIAIVTAFPLVILLFPDGMPASRGWRRIVGGYVALAAVNLACKLALVAVALSDHRLSARTVNNGPGGGLLYNQPAGTRWLGIAAEVFAVAAGVLIVASVVHQVISYRRSRGVRRQQLKWLMGGAIVCIAAILLLPLSNPTSNSLAAQIWSQIPWVMFSALPISIAVAILRYRLYDIDRLVSRTLAYAILTAALVGTFVGLVALTTDTLALSSRVGVAASTLAAATLFNPLRVRIQRQVDRRFNRARYDAEAIVGAFTARLRDAVEIDAIRADLLDAVTRAVQPTHASVWIKP